jgi:phenylalanyl-tRNA synthetase alpha chain
MHELITKLTNDLNQISATTKDSLESFRLRFISKKGQIGQLFDEFKQMSGDEKKSVGKALNELKNAAESKFRELQEKLESASATSSTDIDLSLPPASNTIGNLHPLNLTRYKIIQIFERLGFNVSDGPEIEDDWHNFSALNFPDNHPAREMQDTFFVERNPGEFIRK